MEINTEKTYQELLDLLDQNLICLPDKPGETPKSTLDTLWHFSCGYPTPDKEASRCPLPKLSRESYHQLKRLVDKRIDGTPLAHLIGVQQFMGVEFLVDSCALIPRKETEILGDAALNKIREFALHQSSVHVMDICTGMGNLAMAFAFHEPKALVLAADISQEAIILAEKNAAHLALNQRVQFFSGDLFAPFEMMELTDTIDVLTCNPPYISGSKLSKMPAEIISHEPKEAFDGGSFGLTIIMRLIKEAIPFIKDQGWLCFEVGLGQGEGLVRIMKRNANFQTIEQALDIKGNVRAILAQVKK